MEKNLNWAVLGTGVIANEMAQALKAMGKKLYAVGNRTHERQSHLQKNIRSQRYMMTFMRCLQILMWM